MRTRTRLLSLAAAAAVAGLPAVGGAAWQDPVNLSQGQGSSFNDIAVADNGEIAVAWWGGVGPGWFTRITTGGTWGASEAGKKNRTLLSGPNSSFIQQYESGDETWVRQWSGGSWSAGEQVSPGGGTARQVASVLADGKVLSSWLDEASLPAVNVEARRTETDGSLVLPTFPMVAGVTTNEVAERGRDFSQAASPTGTAMLVWGSETGGVGNVRMARYPGSGAFSTPVTLSSGADTGGSLTDVAALSDGRYLTSWTEENDDRVRMRMVDAAGAPDPTTHISPAGARAEYQAVAAGNDGSALGIWTEEVGATCSLMSRHFAANGAITEARVSDGYCGGDSDPLLIARTSGGYTAVFTDEAVDTLRAAHFTGGAWGSPEVVATGTGRQGAVSGAPTPGGGLVVTYASADQANLFARKYTADPPAAAPAAAPVAVPAAPPAAAPAAAPQAPAATPACADTFYQQANRTIRWNAKRKAYRVVSRIRVFEDAPAACRTKLSVIYRSSKTKVSLAQKSGSTLGYRKLKGNFNAPVISWPTRKEMRFTTGDTTGQNRKNARLVLVSYLKKAKNMPKLNDIEMVIVRRIPRDPRAAKSSANPLYGQKSTFGRNRAWAGVQ